MLLFAASGLCKQKAVQGTPTLEELVMSSWLEREYAAIPVAPTDEDCPRKRCHPTVRAHVQIVEGQAVLPVVEKYPTEEIDVGRIAKRLNVKIPGLP
jgi:hypothetical protein